jgi:hypothetical protein
MQRSSDGLQAADMGQRRRYRLDFGYWGMLDQHIEFLLGPPMLEVFASEGIVGPAPECSRCGTGPKPRSLPIARATCPGFSARQTALTLDLLPLIPRPNPGRVLAQMIDRRPRPNALGRGARSKEV